MDLENCALLWKFLATPLYFLICFLLSGKVCNLPQKKYIKMIDFKIPLCCFHLTDGLLSMTGCVHTGTVFEAAPCKGNTSFEVGSM